MKIGNTAEKIAQAQQATAKATSPAADANKAQAAATPTKPDASAKIELSSAATGLMAGGSTAEFDADKVARISKQIEEGSFKINPEVIADKLISNAQEVLTKTH
ncbi:hypothetical protein BH11PSE8_BH11PSE8_16240 [soil metagenome]